MVEIQAEQTTQPEPKKETKQPKFLGEVAVLPPASEFEDSTLVKLGSKVYIKQNDLWETLIEGTNTKEIIKYAPVGGGCGVEEVKRLISENVVIPQTTYYTNFLSLLSSVPSPSIGATAGIAGGGILKYTSAGWLGDLGTFATKAEIDSITSAADGSSASAFGSKYTKELGGWVLYFDRFVNSKTSNNLYDPTYQVSPNIIVNKFVYNVDGTFLNSAQYFVTSKISAAPGDRFVIMTASSAVDNMGCYYNGDTFVSSIFLSITSGECVVPSGVDNMRLTVEKAVAAPTRFIYKIENSKYKRPRRLTINGDSIAFGTLSVQSFASILNETIGCSYITNLGVAASTYTAPGYTPIYSRNSSIPSDTDIYVLLGGTNDYGLFTSGAPLGTSADADTLYTTFYGALKAAVIYPLTNFPQAKIVLCTPPRRYGMDNPNAQGLKLSDYCAAIRNVANYYGVMLCDLYNDCGIDPNLYSHARMFFNTDKLHPNNLGHKMIADCILRSIY